MVNNVEVIEILLFLLIILTITVITATYSVLYMGDKSKNWLIRNSMIVWFIIILIMSTFGATR